MTWSRFNKKLMWGNLIYGQCPICGLPLKKVKDYECECGFTLTKNQVNSIIYPGIKAAQDS